MGLMAMIKDNYIFIIEQALDLRLECTSHRNDSSKYLYDTLGIYYIDALKAYSKARSAIIQIYNITGSVDGVRDVIFGDRSYKDVHILIKNVDAIKAVVYELSIEKLAMIFFFFGAIKND